MVVPDSPRAFTPGKIDGTGNVVDGYVPVTASVAVCHPVRRRLPGTTKWGTPFRRTGARGIRFFLGRIIDSSIIRILNFFTTLLCHVIMIRDSRTFLHCQYQHHQNRRPQLLFLRPVFSAKILYFLNLRNTYLRVWGRKGFCIIDCYMTFIALENKEGV